jgi:voltage-gated potassium channel
LIGFVLALVLLALAVALVPLRFTRAVRRGLRDPEFRSLFVLVVLTLAAGTIFYRDVEGWSLLDSFYFSAITLATVGYGDLVPSTAGGKLFTVFYVFAGVGIIFAFVEAVARASVARRDETRTLIRRRFRTSEPENDDPPDREEEDRDR